MYTAARMSSRKYRSQLSSRKYRSQLRNIDPGLTVKFCPVSASKSTDEFSFITMRQARRYHF